MTKFKLIKFTKAILAAQIVFICASGFAKDTTKDRANEKVGINSAIDSLRAGNERFVSGHVRNDGQTKEDISRLSTGQAPKSIVLSCSDSRVPPELVFDQKLGEMFTVRTAGESLSKPTIGSIEYAVAKLKTPLLVVMGHTNCGAVKEAVESMGSAPSASENLADLVADIQPRLRDLKKTTGPSKDLREEGWSNAQGVAADLLKRSNLIRTAIEEKRLKLVVGLYNLASGTVEFREPTTLKN